MNELTQERIAEQFIKLADEADLKNTDIAERLGISAIDISYIRNPRYHNKISKKNWGIIRDFVNSGKKLKDYTAAERPDEKKETPRKENDQPKSEVKVQTIVNRTVESQKFGIDIDITITVNGKQIAI